MGLRGAFLVFLFSLLCFAQSLAQAAYTLEEGEASSSLSPISITLLSDIDYRPYVYVENESAIGLLPDIVAMIDEKLDRYSIKIEPKRFSAGKNHLRDGTYLGLLGTYFHAHDWPYAYPYSYPLYFESLVTVCRANVFKNKNASWPKDYAGLKIGTIKGYDGWLSDEIRFRSINTVNFFEFPTISLALNGVYKDVVDCTLFEKTTFAQTLDNLISQGKIADKNALKIQTVISRHSVHLAYSFKAYQSDAYPYALDFQKSFDAALYQLIESGELLPLFEKYGVPYQ